MTQEEIKREIAKTMCSTSFRKFGNAFRKCINKYFSQEMNKTELNGMTWQEYASYVIGDGNYRVTEEQYIQFKKEIFKINKK